MAYEVRILMAIVAKRSGRCLEQRMHACGAPISSLQHGVMRLLSQQQYTISELSRKMMLTPATLVPAIDTLERHGFVTRGQDPQDRRRTPLSLTERGGDILGRVPVVDDDDVVVQSLKSFTLAEREQLLVMLRRLVSSMVEGDEIVAELSKTLRAPE